MDSTEIFTQALGLSAPWRVERTSFIKGDIGSKELHIYIGFEAGSKFVIGGSEPLPVHDTIDRSWRHLNFFEHRCYLHARVPRIRTSEHEVHMVEVPWARPESGFTLLFEAYAMFLIEEGTPVSGVAKVVKETAPRIWRIFKHWVGKAVNKIDMSGLRLVGVDETSKRKGHDYITQFVDLEARKTVFVTEGRGMDTFERFRDRLLACGGKVENIEAISMDMSPSFIAGAMTYFPNAGIIFDKFHLFSALNQALDRVRKQEHEQTRLLKGQKYTFLHLRKHLPQSKQATLDTLLLTYPTIGKAYGFRESFFDIFSADIYEPDPEGKLKQWCKAVAESAIAPMVAFANMVKTHMYGIRTLLANKDINNGILEGLNSLIQLAKRRARGYTNVDNFIAMVYFTTGKMKLDYPQEML